MPRKKKSCVSSENHRLTSSVSSVSINKDKPIQRNAANARERARMRVLSRAFCRLKTTLPWVPADTKLSKLDTLRLAASYIAHLKGILRDDPFAADDNNIHPSMSLTWPFGFNRGAGNGSAGGASGSDDGESGGSSWEDQLDQEQEDDKSVCLAHLNSPSANTHFHHHHHLNACDNNNLPLNTNNNNNHGHDNDMKFMFTDQQHHHNLSLNHHHPSNPTTGNSLIPPMFHHDDIMSIG